MIKPNRKDRLRAYLRRKGYSVDDIAAQTSGSTLEIQESFFRFDAYASSVSTEEVDLAINDMLIGSIGDVGKALKGALSATVKHAVPNGKKKNGETRYKTVTRPDHETRLTAISRFETLTGASRPKASGVAVNVNTQVNNPSASGYVIPGGSFEQRVRALKAARGEEIEDDVVEAEELETQSVEDELLDIGIDLDEEDDDDDEE